MVALAKFMTFCDLPHDEREPSPEERLWQALTAGLV